MDYDPLIYLPLKHGTLIVIHPVSKQLHILALLGPIGVEFAEIHFPINFDPHHGTAGEAPRFLLS